MPLRKPEALLSYLLLLMEHKYEFQYEVFNDISELSEDDAWLLTEAREVTEQA